MLFKFYFVFFDDSFADEFATFYSSFVDDDFMVLSELYFIVFDCLIECLIFSSSFFDVMDDL